MFSVRHTAGILQEHCAKTEGNPNQSITEAIENGFAYVTEDRKEYGLILMDDIKRNISLTGLSKLAKNMVIDEREEILVAEDMRKKLKIKTPNILQKTETSAGNQQKVVLSKWIYAEPDILILDEPTRGLTLGPNTRFTRSLISWRMRARACLSFPRSAGDYRDLRPDLCHERGTAHRRS